MTVVNLTGGATRPSELENAGRRLHFAFLGEVPTEESTGVAALPFLPDPGDARVSNYMLRTEGRETLGLFDLAYGRGKGRHEVTLASLHSPRLALPHFALRPERTIDRLFRLIGRRDISFDADPVFSKRYFLRAYVEGAVRALFTPERRAAFADVEPCLVAGAGRRLIYFEPDHLVWPEGLDAFLSRAGLIFAAFRG